jgi:hypothetical protein
LKQNDLFVIVASRRGNPSYQPAQDKLPYYLSNYFTENSFLLLYPRQLEQGIKLGDIDHADSSLAEKLVDGIQTTKKAGSFIRNIFGKKKGR